MELINKLILSKRELIKFTNDNLLSGKGILLSYFDFNAFNIALKCNRYFNLLNRHFYSFQDGVGIYLFLKSFQKRVDRIISTNYYYYLLKKLRKKNSKVFLVGYDYNIDFVIQKAEEKQLNLSGYYKGYFTKNEFLEIVNLIRVSKTKYVFIGTGKPKQELIAYELKRYLPEVNYICVGDFFNYYFGIKKRAPFIFRKLGIEWLYRFLREPKRLATRYILGIPYFIYSILSIRKNNYRGRNNERQKNIDNMLNSCMFYK